MRAAFAKSAGLALVLNGAIWIAASLIGLVPALGESTFFGGVLFASVGQRRRRRLWRADSPQLVHGSAGQGSR